MNFLPSFSKKFDKIHEEVSKSDFVDFWKLETILETF